MAVSNQQTTNLLRLRRFRLGQSEPNFTSSQMTSSYQTSPRTSSVTTTNILSHRSNARRPNLSGSNLINIKHAFRKQLSPQQQQSFGTTSDPSQDVNTLDDHIHRRWSLTSAPSSSGYGTTSPPSSQYSSFERLQHQQHICTCKQQSDSNSHDDSQRLESRSISMSLLDANISSLPNKLLLVPDQDINTMAYIYKERYPKAKVQMEERLQHFIETYKLIDKFDYCSDGSARFIHNQIVELGKDCLEKSSNDLITSLYFNEMTENLERLLLNAKEKCPQAVEDLQTIVRTLLLITARSARLLECLHFDPESFLRTLEEIEWQAKTITNLKQDIPKYICSKLNLERNPLDVIDGLQVKMILK
jgi:microtubule-associated serine/threonine kinase